MVQKKDNEFSLLEQLIRQRFDSARKRAKSTQDPSMNRYYKGQVDALHVVLRDIDTMKFESGMELILEEQNRQALDLAAPAEELETGDTFAPAKTRGGRPKKTTEAKPAKPAAPDSPHKALAEDALQRGVIARRVSWFYHAMLPNGRAKGFDQLFRALENDAAFRQAVQEACAQPVAAPQPLNQDVAGLQPEEPLAA